MIRKFIKEILREILLEEMDTIMAKIIPLINQGSTSSLVQMFMSLMDE